MRRDIRNLRLLLGLGAVLTLVLALACTTEVEVPGKAVVVPGETIVQTVEVPGETIVVPGETIVKTVEVPGETIVKTVEVPGETIVKTVEVPGETIVVTEVVTPDPAAPLVIGQLNAFTGTLSYFGLSHRNGATLAADQINRAGGVLGSPVIIISRDTGVNPVQAVDAANALIDVENAVAIVGALASGVTMPVATSVTSQKGVIQISGASTSPALTVLDDNDFLFRTTVSDAAQGVVLGRLARELGYDTASALYINNAYGEGLADQFKATFEAEGGTVLELVPHEDVQPTFASELSTATEGTPDVLVAIGYPGQAEIYLREALEGDYISNFLFVDGTKSPEMNAVVGWDNLEGTYGTAPGSVANDARATFERDYAGAFAVEIPPHPFIAETYDAVALIALAAEKAGSTTDSIGIRDAIRSVANPPGEIVGPGVASLSRALELIRQGVDINYEGAAGSQDFDANGDVVSTIEIWKIEGGEIVSTGRFELP